MVLCLRAEMGSGAEEAKWLLLPVAPPLEGDYVIFEFCDSNERAVRKPPCSPPPLTQFYPRFPPPPTFLTPTLTSPLTRSTAVAPRFYYLTHSYPETSPGGPRVPTSPTRNV